MKDINQVLNAIEVLNIEKNSVIILKGNWESEAIELMASGLHIHGLENPVIVVSEGQSLETLPFDVAQEILKKIEYSKSNSTEGE